MLESVRKSPSTPIHLLLASPKPILDPGHWWRVKASEKQDAGSETSAQCFHGHYQLTEVSFWWNISVISTLDHHKGSQTSGWGKKHSLSNGRQIKWSPKLLYWPKITSMATSFALCHLFFSVSWKEEMKPIKVLHNYTRKNQCNSPGNLFIQNQTPTLSIQDSLLFFK